MSSDCVHTRENEARGRHYGNGVISGVTGVILAGGSSSRMGKNKALLKIGEQTLIERVYGTMAMLFTDVIIVTNTPESYPFIPCRMVADIYPGFGSIAGLHAGLSACSTEWIFAVACDMPFLNHELIRMICDLRLDYDAVVPLNSFGLREPLHALYARSALLPMQQAIESGDKSILDLLDRVRTELVTNDQVHSIDQAEESFRNLNTLQEYAEVTELLRGAPHVCDCAT